MKPSIRSGLVALSLGVAAALVVPAPFVHAGPDDRAAGSGAVFQEANRPLQETLSEAAKSSKNVIVYLRNPQCPWCMRLEKEVYPTAETGKATSSFLLVSYDASGEQGKAVMEKYRVRGVPTLLVLGVDGLEVDRIEGYRPTEEFVKEVGRIQQGQETIPALRKKVAENPNDTASRLALARRLSDSSPREAVALVEGVTAKSQGDRAADAEAWITLARAARNSDDAARANAAYARVLTDYSDTEYAGEALQASVPGEDVDAAQAYLGKVRKTCKNPRLASFADAMVAEVHLHAAEQALARRAELAKDDAQALNEIAWTSFERKLNLDKATDWARRAVELSKREPVVLDTLANILFLTGNVDEAITLEKEAVAGIKDEMVKAEFGETLAKFEATAAYRRDHPAAAADLTARDENRKSPEGQGDSKGDGKGERKPAPPTPGESGQPTQPGQQQPWK